MFVIQPIVDVTSVVLVGSFNPTIFQPAWFSQNGILSKSDADAAAIAIIHPETVAFKAGEYTFQIDLQKFTLNCETTHNDMIKDLIISTFGDFLTHTPITSIGINRFVHFDTGDFWIRDKVGLMLAPHAPWGDWGTQITGSDEDKLKHGGLLRIMMRETRKDANFPGNTNAEVQTSNHPLLKDAGIFMMVNDHFELSSNGAVSDSRSMLTTLDANWSSSIEKSTLIINQIMKLSKQCAQST